MKLFLKYLYSIALLCVLTISLSSCTKREKNALELLGIDKNKVTAVEMMSGNTGKKVTITDAKTVAAIIKKCQEPELIYYEDKTVYVGFSVGITFLNGKTPMGSFSPNNRTMIKQKKYKVKNKGYDTVYFLSLVDKPTGKTPISYWCTGTPKASR